MSGNTPMRRVYDEARNMAITKTTRDALTLTKPLIRFRGTPEEMAEKRRQIVAALTIAAARLDRLEAGRPTG